MRSQLSDMEPVDDFVTQNTPGLKIWQEVWGDMQCAYHHFDPGTDFTALLAPCRTVCAVSRTTPTSSAARSTSSTRTGPSTCQGRGRVLLAGSAQLHLGRGRGDHPVQRRWRPGQQAGIVEASWPSGRPRSQGRPGGRSTRCLGRGSPAVAAPPTAVQPGTRPARPGDRLARGCPARPQRRDQRRTYETSEDLASAECGTVSGIHTPPRPGLHDRQVATAWSAAEVATPTGALGTQGSLVLTCAGSTSQPQAGPSRRSSGPSRRTRR